MLLTASLITGASANGSHGCVMCAAKCARVIQCVLKVSTDTHTFHR